MNCASCNDKASIKRPKNVFKKLLTFSTGICKKYFREFIFTFNYFIGVAVCRNCFFKLFEQEIHQTIVRNNLFTSGENVAIGASGGRGTSYAFLNSLFSEGKINKYLFKGRNIKINFVNMLC